MHAAFLACQLSCSYILKIDLYENMYVTTLMVLKEKGINGPYFMENLTAEEIEDKFNTYLFADPETLTFGSRIGMDPNSFWRSIPDYDGTWRAFSCLALMLISLSCSEADVERLISRQRDVQGVHATNMRVDTIEARMRIQMAHTRAICSSWRSDAE